MIINNNNTNNNNNNIILKKKGICKKFYMHILDFLKQKNFAFVLFYFFLLYNIYY